MDATLAGVVDVKKATMRTRPMDNRHRFYHFDEPGNWGTCVRDASWHPNAPLLVGKLIHPVLRRELTQDSFRMERL
jgi:WD repeat-containing protein 23